MKLSSIRSQSVTLVHCKSGKISEWVHWSLPNRTNPKGFSGRTDFDILLVDLFVPGSLSSRSGFCSHVMAMWLSWHNSAHVTRFLTKLQFLLIVWSLGRLCGRVNPRVPFVKGLLGTYFLQRIHANMLCNHRSWAGVCGEKWWPAVGSCSCHEGCFPNLLLAGVWKAPWGSHWVLLPYYWQKSDHPENCQIRALRLFDSESMYVSYV